MQVVNLLIQLINGYTELIRAVKPIINSGCSQAKTKGQKHCKAVKTLVLV